MHFQQKPTPSPELEKLVFDYLGHFTYDLDEGHAFWKQLEAPACTGK